MESLSSTRKKVWLILIVFLMMLVGLNLLQPSPSSHLSLGVQKSAPLEKQAVFADVFAALSTLERNLNHSVSNLQKEIGSTREDLLAKLDEQQSGSSVVRHDESIGTTASSSGRAAEVAHDHKNRRKFVSYTSSKWEQMWLENVDEWAKNEDICKILLEDHVDYVHDFLKLTCTGMLDDKWCVIDDGYNPLYYNTQNRSDFDLRFTNPTAKNVTPSPVRPNQSHEHIASKFVFLDEVSGKEYIEYIEPLVSHLRHPLAKCTNAGEAYPLALALFRGYVIPPPSLPFVDGKFLYFDAGSSSWTDGGGGPSLSYFVEIWNRHDINFDRIQAYELTTSPKEFYDTLPKEFQNKTLYRQCAVSSSSKEETVDNPFIPHDIERIAKSGDYVFFKLDIDSPHVEDGSIQYILENDEVTVHEVAWEHHVHGNYLMRPNWGSPLGVKYSWAPLTLKESYDYFLKMRKKGIRSHSWI